MDAAFAALGFGLAMGAGTWIAATLWWRIPREACWLSVGFAAIIAIAWEAFALFAQHAAMPEVVSPIPLTIHLHLLAPGFWAALPWLIAVAAVAGFAFLIGAKIGRRQPPMLPDAAPRVEAFEVFTRAKQAALPAKENPKRLEWRKSG